MKANTFIWTDLSSHKPIESINFYKTIFAWDLVEYDRYTVAHKGHKGIVGMYETPDFFKSINMPHFWMNYIQVEEVENTVKKAEQLGGRIEIRKDEFFGGYIALIRDPMGAGFTIYSGNQLEQDLTRGHGSVLSQELHTSDLGMVKEFYAQLFDWDIQKNGVPRTFKASALDGKRICSILEIDNKIKGKYEYWITTFGVKHLDSVKTQIIKLGGQVISNEGHRVLCCDLFGEAFFYIEELMTV